MKKNTYDGYFWQDKLVRLRSMEQGDWESHYYNRFDTSARRLLNYEVELPPTRSEAENMIENFIDFKQETGRIMFTIETINGENVGGINLNSIDEKNGTFSIGMQIDRDHRGKGYGTAAMCILLRYAFLERRLNKYYGSVLDGNIASATMLKKLGCLQEGVRRQMVYSDGRYIDEILFGLTKDEFNSELN
ncbi:N-acetyltransferase [Paraliobacillus quinghaiensis]|uniref:N-acetyltransferase n=1 Tax=Paraliobacillus quinghaiensis TaxID=470815 RepID=A0A917TU68_9BACI|nr:GNAT family protein [Paraliobacillus quinghaiensis]GGM38477.1 N-acetyltransferase [Paraliobacillus quinghaiensis]